MRTLELWGGHECTVNRVGGVFHDQTVRSGHHQRESDLDLFADLGVKALRYPLLWERIAPDRPGEKDWSWTDGRLGRMRELGVRPIAGLLHHGSGPRYTSLVDEGFPALFGSFARSVAERYPWIRDWTPINEPLTTARFSALYGHWYPHLTDEPMFWAALINEVEATIRAMREIRAVNPEARLIQTEDLGRTYSTREVAYQAEFENLRRWMTWDLLFGLVRPGHPLWPRLAGFGFAERLRRIADMPCPPDVLGVNHYLTSERFLDHRIGQYPPERIGGNGETAYADVEAIRVTLPAPRGLEGVLEEAWARYGRPMAITESHNGCTREEQVRWLRDGWRTALRLRERGVPVEAVTAWALLGAYDWNSLLTRHVGHYETGAFDVRSGAPRPTAIAREIARLAAGGHEPAHPATFGPGWWRRDIRLEFQPAFLTDEPAPRAAFVTEPGPERPLLIAGSGPVARELARACEWRGIDYRLRERAGEASDVWAAITTDGDAPLMATSAVGVLTLRAAPFFSPYEADLTPQANRATYLPDFVEAALDMLVDGETGEHALMNDGVSLPPLDQALARYAARTGSAAFLGEAEARVEGAVETRAVEGAEPGIFS